MIGFNVLRTSGNSALFILFYFPQIVEDGYLGAVRIAPANPNVTFLECAL
ncbi:hypothetical protein QG37_02417 [Candidozyma auris]|uniref:Uncharacterized protein n=1 Tax=Candidozyma auris TaxID=498019 RepID=A0A0L0P1Y9_CANAR|nr:hypothetical protein QG37_02417 [[Candida] auris]